MQHSDMLILKCLDFCVSSKTYAVLKTLKTLERCKHVIYILKKGQTGGGVIEKSHNWEIFIFKLFPLYN